MSAVAFGTLTAARDLEAAGIERRQAEAIAGTVRTAADSGREALATKADLAELRADTKAGHACSAMRSSNNPINGSAIWAWMRCATRWYTGRRHPCG